MSPTEVTVSQGGANKRVPVNQIESITFEEDSQLVRTARDAAVAGRYEDALKALENVKVDEIERAEIKEDVEFYAALELREARLGWQARDPGGGQADGGLCFRPSQEATTTSRPTSSSATCSWPSDSSPGHGSITSE